MKIALFLLAFCTGFAAYGIAGTAAEPLRIRQRTGGLLQVQAQTGFNILIRPNESAEVPDDLKAASSFVLGQELEPTVFRPNGRPADITPEPGSPIPKNGFLIQSAMIGSQRAAIQLRTQELNIMFVSVEIMSDQGFIATGPDRKVNLIVLTFDDAKKLHNARANLWLSRMETQQIALNPLSDFPAASADKLHKSLKRNRTLPTAVLPMIEIPNRLLQYGDRQVVVLKPLK